MYLFFSTEHAYSFVFIYFYFYFFLLLFLLFFISYHLWCIFINGFYTFLLLHPLLGIPESKRVLNIFLLAFLFYLLIFCFFHNFISSCYGL